MRNYLIDANVIIAMLISGKSLYKKLVLDYNFLSIDFAFEEIEKYKELIADKTKLDRKSFKEFSYFIFSNISFLPNYILESKSILEATESIKGIDNKDIKYIALAIQYDYLLLTRDKILNTGLRKKGIRRTLLFDEFMKYA